MELKNWFDLVVDNYETIEDHMYHNDENDPADNGYQWILYHVENNMIKGIVCSDVFFFPFIAHAEEETAKHSHSFVEIGYVIEGELHQQFENETVVFPKGSLFMIGRGVQHRELMASSKSIYFYLTFPLHSFSDLFLRSVSSEVIYEFIQRCLIDKKDRLYYLLFRPKKDANAQKILYSITEEIYRHQNGYDYFIQGNLIRLFDELTSNYEIQLKKEVNEELKEVLYRKVCSYISDHCTDISLAHLSDVFHYNTAYFNRLIQEYSGMKFKDYLQKCRLEKSKELLLKATDPIYKIAESVGYKNQTFFYQLFESEYGITPAEYRNTAKL